MGAKGSELKAGGRRDFPLGLVEGQESIKTALLLTAINPEIQVRGWMGRGEIKGSVEGRYMVAPINLSSLPVPPPPYTSQSHPQKMKHNRA